MSNRPSRRRPRGRPRGRPGGRPEGRGPEQAQRWIALLEAHCEEHLGPVALFSCLDDGRRPHVDVHYHAATEGRPYVTIHTSGLSTVRTSAPREAIEYSHIELVTYLPGEWEIPGCAECGHGGSGGPDWPVRLLGLLANYVQRSRTWLGPGHTVDHYGPAPGGPEHLTGTLVAEPSFELPSFDQLEIEGCPVRFLHVIPVTAAEIAFKKELCSHVVLNLLQRTAAWPVIDPERSCVVAGTAHDPA